MSLRMFSIAVLFVCLSLVGPGLATAKEPTEARQTGGPVCVDDVSVEKLGQVMPDDASGLALVTLRVTFAPGGEIAAHTHPGTLVVSIVSGEFEFTMLENVEHMIMRGGTASQPSAAEHVAYNVPVVLEAGDWFEDPSGIVHSASNPGTEPTVALVSGLVDPDQPFTQCVLDSSASH